MAVAETLVRGLARLLQDAGKCWPPRASPGRVVSVRPVCGRSRPGLSFPFLAGDLVLDGSSTLTLLTSTLQHLTQVFEQHLGSRNQNRGFVALPSHPAETAAILQAQFLFDVLQKTHSLKVCTYPVLQGGPVEVAGTTSEQPPLVPIAPVWPTGSMGQMALTGLLRGVVAQHDSL